MIIKNKYATFVGHKFNPKFRVVVQKWTAPDAPNDTGILASTALKSTVQTITTGITQPDFPRILNVDSDSTDATGKVIITGTNIREEPISEEFTLNGTTVVTGTKAFKSVKSIQLPVKAASESVFVGTTDKLGLQEIPYSTSVIAEVSGNANDTGGVILTRDSDEIEKCVYDPTTQCDGNTNKMIAYLSEETDAKIFSYTE